MFCFLLVFDCFLKDPELNEQLQRLIGSLVDALAVAAPSRLVALCREILESRELRKPTQGSSAFSGPTGDEGKLRYADEEGDDDDAKQAGPEQDDPAIKVFFFFLFLFINFFVAERGPDIYAVDSNQAAVSEQRDASRHDSACSSGTSGSEASSSCPRRQWQGRLSRVQLARAGEHGLARLCKLGQLLAPRRFFFSLACGPGYVVSKL